MRRSAIIAIAALAVISCTNNAAQYGEVKSWGDQGDGTYANPVLVADFSDPDVIRVDDTFYMVASDFHFMGIQILKSSDLVNWEYITQIYERLDFPDYDNMNAYSAGSWAPSIRYHDGKFYVYFCTPTEGLFMTCAEKPEGPWSELTFVHEGGPDFGWEDPCPFWDEDGQAYLGRSQLGAGPIILHRMSADGKQLLDDGTVIYEGDVAEGTKFLKKDGWYYLLIPEGGVAGGYQVALRAKNIYGPYERKVVLEQGSTNVNGPHQGGFVDTPEGSWWFMHFQHTDELGRIVHLQPVNWVDGWPLAGEDLDGNGIGEPVSRWPKPVAGCEPSKPASSDDFEATTLGAQWQFNHNPVNEAWSLTENPGELTIHALQADDFRHARNTVTQKMFGFEGVMTVKLATSDLAEGQHCGLAFLGGEEFIIGARKVDGKLEIYRENLIDGEYAEDGSASFGGKAVWLRCEYNTADGTGSMSYSSNGREFITLGGNVKPAYGYWKGPRPGIFCYNTKGNAGVARFDDFEYSFN